MTCFSTRAVALMPLKLLDAQSMVRALVKLDALFPGVKHLYSDNVTNFVGANKEMKEARKDSNDITYNPALQATEINWDFFQHDLVQQAECGKD